MIFFWHVSVTIVSIETSNMELFMKIIGKFYLLTTSKKSSIINASQVRKYAFVGIVSLTFYKLEYRDRRKSPFWIYFGLS